MIYFWLIILILLNAVWLISVPFALPGNWLIVITTSLFAWRHSGDGIFSVYTIICILALALLGELFEFFGGLSGAKKAGASLRGSIGAVIGAITGAVFGTFIIPIPLFGTIIGSGIGAAIGACAFELSAAKKPKQALHSGLGAGFGQILGISAKIIIGGLIWLIVTVAAFWP